MPPALELYRLRALTDERPSTSRASQWQPMRIKFAPKSVSSPISVPDEVVIISDSNDDILSPRRLFSDSSKRAKLDRSSPMLPKLEFGDESLIDLTLSDDELGDSAVTSSSKKWKRGKRQKSDNLTKVTQKEWVLHVKHITSVPSVWDVHREPTAYILDLSGDTWTLEKRSGEDHSIQSFICHEVRVLSNCQRIFLINF